MGLWITAPSLYASLSRRRRMAFDEASREPIRIDAAELDRALQHCRDQMSEAAFEKLQDILAGGIVDNDTMASSAIDTADRPPAYAALPGGGTATPEQMQRALAGDSARRKLAGDNGFDARFPNAARIRQL